MLEYVVSRFDPLFLLKSLLFLSLLIIQIAEEQSNEEVFSLKDRKGCEHEELIEGRGRVVWI